MNVLTRNLPNAVTSINLLAGTASILAATHGSEEWCGLAAYYWAMIFIAIAAVADFMDGFVARALHAYSDMGRELDSLCDLVSFGVAPAVLMYFAMQECGARSWLHWVVLLIPLCGALRLARFNVMPSDNSLFRGLPIPANAIFWIGFVAWYRNLEIISPWFILAVLIIIPWLMVSSIRMYTLKFAHWRLRGNVARWSIVIAAPVCCICMGVVGLMWLVIYYILLSLATAHRGA